MVGTRINLGLIIALILVLAFVSNMISPLIMAFKYQNSDIAVYPTFGTPKPAYVIDISDTCVEQKDDILVGLTYLTNKTGVEFISVPYPAALIYGGISYTCITNFEDAQNTWTHQVGEARRSYGGNGLLNFAFNTVVLENETDQNTILHETLHAMGLVTCLRSS